MKAGEQRYFLALIPQEPLDQKIYDVKVQIAENFNSKGALKSPAHLTLHMPFLWKERNEDRLIQKLVQATSFESFNLFLDGFGAFPPKTIYVKNKASAKLQAFQKELCQFTKRNLHLYNSTHNRGFHPHITVAFRDLKKEQFEMVWSEYQDKKFEAKMVVNSFWLLKHDGKLWHAYKEFEFKGRG